MSDIFALNLRSVAKRELRLGHVEIGHILNAAAVEIELLRAALTEIASLKAEDMYRADDDNQAAFIARNALEQSAGGGSHE